MRMSRRFYRVTRDLHLYSGMFVSPFVLVFAASVFFLVHAWLPKPSPAGPRKVSDLPLPENLETLSGRALIDALRPALEKAGVAGEIGFVRHLAKEHQFIAPVSVPGRLSTVTIDVARREGAVDSQVTGLADAVVVLHKSPGPHLADLRMNWFYMGIWRWLADATVYLVLFLSLSGIYLWYVLRSERRIGLGLLAAGALSFLLIVYGLGH